MDEMTEEMERAQDAYEDSYSVDHNTECPYCNHGCEDCC